MIKQKQPGKVFRKVDGKWKVSAYFCMRCNKQITSEILIHKHINNCKYINTINKEKHMPIHRITKNGETFYRWGDTGKLYRNRSDAEAQARAAYSSGYKSKEDNNSSKKKGSDGRVCWEGYRYGGSNTDGSDKCIKVRK